MSYRHSLPLIALALVGLASGTWLVLSPWVLALQPAKLAWNANTTTHFWTGIGVVTMALVTAMAAGMPMRSAVARKARPQSKAHPLATFDQGERPTNQDDMIVLLATALLNEIDDSSKLVSAHHAQRSTAHESS